MKLANLKNAALEMLKENENLFCDMIEELDNLNGFADGFRCYPMAELDDLFSCVKVSEFVQKLGRHFDFYDDYMMDTIYGLESTNDRGEIYLAHTDEEDVLDNVIDNASHLWLDYDEDFAELIDAIVNYDEDEDDPEAVPC